MPWINKTNTTSTGKQAEAFARQYLTQHGLSYVTSNFHNRGGEIDLIMKQQNTWVFVEVKYRKNNQFGGALASVSSAKQQKIKQCAAFYLQSVGLNEYNTSCRFDVIALEGNIEQPHVNWLENAF